MSFEFCQMSLNLLVMIALVSGVSACSRSPQPSTQVAPVVQQVMQPRTFGDWVDLGLSHSKAGRHEQAIAAWRQAARLDPTSAVPHNNICAEFNTLKRWILAREACEMALKLAPGFQLAQNNLELARSSETAVARKVAELDSAIAAGREPDLNRINVGQLLYDEGAYAGALRYWGQIPSSSGLHALAQSNRASALILLGRLGEAEEALGVALKLQPNNPLFQGNARWLADEKAARGLKH